MGSKYLKVSHKTKADEKQFGMHTGAPMHHHQGAHMGHMGNMGHHAHHHHHQGYHPHVAHQGMAY
jgi:hypothetical protein